DYGTAANGRRQGQGATGRKIRETQDIMADHHRDLLFVPAVGARAALRRYANVVVEAGLARRRTRSYLDHGRPNDLFRTSVCLEESRTDRDRGVTLAPNFEQTDLEYGLRNFNAVAGLQRHIFPGIFPELTDIKNSDLTASQKSDAFLISEIVESAGGTNCRQQ